MKKGFTLIEILIVLAVVGILLAIGSINLVAYQRRLNIEQATTQVATDLSRARMDARRTNQTIEFIANEDQATYEYGPVGDRRTVNLPEGISFVAGLNVSFNPPYGVLNLPNSFLQMSGYDQTRQVNLIGVMGKVVIREP
jgi:type IV pilus assembly protein PilA